nr:hypothetical protein [Microbacterium sp. NIBRBAC000506063]
MGAPEVILDVLGDVVDDALRATAALGRRVVDLTIVAFAPVGGEPAIVLADTDLEWGPVDVIGGLRTRLAVVDELAGSLEGGVRLVGDTTVAAMAEYAVLDRPTDMLYLKSNSGIGGAIVTPDGLYGGANGFAGPSGISPSTTGARAASADSTDAWSRSPAPTWCSRAQASHRSWTRWVSPPLSQRSWRAWTPETPGRWRRGERRRHGSRMPFRSCPSPSTLASSFSAGTGLICPKRSSATSAPHGPCAMATR